MTNYNNLSFLKDYSLPEKLSDIIYFSFNKKEGSDFKKVIKKVEEKLRAEIKQIEEQINYCPRRNRRRRGERE